MQIMRTVAAAMFFCLGSSSALGQSGFGVIRVGGPVSTLPFSCTDALYCEGNYRSSWVRVDVLGGIINSVDVIYFGNTVTVDPATLAPIVIRSSPITLAQAIKLHSLQAGAKAPVFGLAKGEGGKVYGLVDISNEIVYKAGGTSPASTVEDVFYARSDAPVLEDAANSQLANHGNSLLQAATSSEPYTNANPPKNVREGDADAPLSTQKAANHAEAVEGLKERSDTVIGSGKMVLALIEQVSTWYQVDKEHPTAIAKSEELKRMYPKFFASWRDIILYAEANKSLLKEQNLGAIPFDLNKEVESQMRQLKAMGFEE